MADKGKNKVVEAVVGVVIVAMVAFMLWLWVSNYNTLINVAEISESVAQRQTDNYRYYVQEYKVTKNALDETSIKLAQVTEELQAANLELSNMRGELSEVQQLSDDMKGNIQALERYTAAAKAKGEALETMIISFKQKNRELDRQLQAVRKELAVFQPDINDLQEGRSKVSLFKEHIKLVKKNMVVIKKEAHAAKVATQKEHDRLETLYGNNGYLVKDGEDRSVTSFDQKKVNIDVKFVNQ